LCISRICYPRYGGRGWAYAPGGGFVFLAGGGVRFPPPPPHVLPHMGKNQAPA
jgi:hypothetical protein